MESTKPCKGAQVRPRRILLPRAVPPYDSRIHGQQGYDEDLPSSFTATAAEPTTVNFAPAAKIEVTDLPLDIAVKRFKGVRGSPPNLMACCPAHHDTTPSLSLTEMPDGKLLIHCHAGCPVENVLAAVGLDLRHLYPSGYAQRFNRRSNSPRSSTTPLERLVDERIDEPKIDHDRFYRIIEAARKGCPRKLKRFARELEVTTGALDLLGVGVEQDLAAFPEWDDRRRPVGVCYRACDGQRTFEPGGKRGLTIPLEQPTERGPLYIAEGATDTAALVSAGVQAVGRPAAKPSRLSTQWLVRYLERRSEQIVVLGDNDDPHTRKGVGESAAKALGAELSLRLGRSVAWALPRPGYKDVREQVADGEWSRGVEKWKVRA